MHIRIPTRDKECMVSSYSAISSSKVQDFDP